MIDFHSHILPCADHGSKSLEMSVSQVKKAKECGISTIVATPHFYYNKENVEDFLERRNYAYEQLVSTLKQQNIDVNIINAVELNLQVDLFKIKDFSVFCIPGTKYILVELPLNVILTKWHYLAIDEIISMGYTPIIAHINRYHTKAVEPIFDKDVLFQCNIEAFDSFKSLLRIKRLYKKDCLHLIGSDIHKEHFILYDMMEKYRNKYPSMFKEFQRNAIRVLR